VLCLIGQKCQDEKLLDPLHKFIKIKQKTVQHSPVDKLTDVLLAILLDCDVVSQVNTKLAQEVAVLKAFGREQSADQSSVQRTLGCCDSQNVAQLQHSLAEIFAKNSRTRHHKFAKQPLILDIDLTGLPCSKHYEGSCKGYFADCKPGTTGRQLYRVSASQYNEVVYQQVFPGNTTSASLENFKVMLEAAFAVLALKAKYKKRIVIRLDGGFGNAPIINYLLAQGYQFVVKLGNAPRSIKLCQSVEVNGWQLDQCHQREFGLVQAPSGYEAADSRPVYQIGVRHIPPQPKPKKAGDKVKAKKVEASAASQSQSALKPVERVPYQYNVLVVRVEGLAWAKGGSVAARAQASEILSQVHFYDSRAVIETASIKGDKQGLGLVKRRKFSLMGQEMLVLLAQLGHNLVEWAKGWLAKLEPELASFGVQRWVRDLFAIAGEVVFAAGRIVKVRLSKRNRLARRFYKAIAQYFARSKIAVALGYQ
jgi:Transposase DDE domain group 1